MFGIGYCYDGIVYKDVHIHSLSVLCHKVLLEVYTVYIFIIFSSPKESDGFWLWYFQVDLLRGQKSDKVDVTLQPEELEAMENVLPAKYGIYSFQC